MKEKAAMLLFIMLCATHLFAQNAAYQRSQADFRSAVITDITGTVEIKKSGGLNFIPAKNGDLITGDTVISTMTLALAAKADLPTAAEIANFAAGIVVAKIGTATASPQELKDAVKEFYGMQK